MILPTSDKMAHKVAIKPFKLLLKRVPKKRNCREKGKQVVLVLVLVLIEGKMER
jgi:hypothetical protein